MKSNTPTMRDLYVETHLELKQQGPGSYLDLDRFVDLSGASKIAVLGCGTGEQVLLSLAQKTQAEIVGVDCFPAFIDAFNNNARKYNLQNRVKGIVGDMENLPFQKEEFDYICSEMPIAAVGFGKSMNFVKALSSWSGFLKMGGYITIACPTWIDGSEETGDNSEERPEEIVQFWERAGVDLDTMEFNSTVMERLGYESLIMVAALPDEAWLEYFSAREAVIEKLIKKYSENETIKAFAERAKYEVQLYSEYNYNDIDERYYGYVTYIGRKKIKCAL